MSARRKAIRKAIQTLLKGKTDAGQNVFSNLSSPSWREDLPSVVIYTRSEDIEAQDVSPREYKRTVELAVEIMAEGPEDPNTSDGTFLEDALDDIAEQVEVELNRDERIGVFTNPLGKMIALVDELILNNVEFEYTEEGERPTGSVRMIYNVVYYEHRPATIDEQVVAFNIDDLEKVHIDWVVGHHQEDPDNVIEAKDDVDIPTS